MPSELKPSKPRKGPDDRLERLKGSDPPKTETIAEAALEIYRDDLEAPDEVEALISQMNKEAAATVVTPEGKVADAVTGEVLNPPAEQKRRWKPDKTDLINVQGGRQYLPARMRINWLRGGDPDAHPDWAIYTTLKEHERGKRASKGKVDGGYALFEATIVDELGRHIATGHKAEYSENFADYLEKAETGAIARALAVAGYGTESALDIDEGFEGDRLADAPVGAPIVISGSDVKDVRQGGRQTTITDAQVKAIKAEVKRLGISPEQLGAAMETLELAEFDDEEVDQAMPDQVTDAVTKLTFDEAGRLIQALMQAEPPEGDEHDDDADEDGDPVGAK